MAAHAASALKVNGPRALESLRSTVVLYQM